MRKEDEVEIPSLTLDDDELNQHASGTTEAPVKAKRRLNPPPATRPQATAKAKRPSLFGVYFILLIVLALMGAGGYWLWMQNQQLKAQLLGAQGQIEQLDSQLVETGESADALGSSVEETLANHDSEIRKLWAVAYDRNRTAIAEQSESVKALEERVAQLRESLSTQSKLVAVQGDAFNEIEDGYNRLVDTVAQVEEQQSGQSETLSSLTEAKTEQQQQVSRINSRLDQMAERLAGLDGRVRALGSEVQALGATPNLPDDLTRRLEASEEAIDSIDQFRPQVLREINSLKSQVRQLSLEASLGGG
ncbi:hypothetical protein [Marinomonas ostreistagni]|uniref:hypothetical protein n=1 Tax=Marinomonas ostreistagni TaxID=359209 RepID=UPI001950BDA4|nr:hypothetical protein [Marinomonas ostreistagni]MBM6549959.1 hypothetical protein [Marinomonas ostreistagni]